jgi:hypothetical protein
VPAPVVPFRVTACVAALTGAVLVLTIPACKQDPMTEQPRTRLTEIAAAPTHFEGEQTVVTGIVRFKYAPNLYMVAPAGNWPPPDQRLLVVATAQPEGAAEVHEGNRVRMLGTIQVVDRKTFAENFPAADAATIQALGDDFFREWDGKPAITATHIRILPRPKRSTTNPATQPAPNSA